jgi:hypothetical protein
MGTTRNVGELLAGIKATGTFATRRTSPADGLRLEVKGVGRIAWPITEATARRLCAVARPARYGLKDRTQLDARIRDTWEIPKGRSTIDRPRWAQTLRPMLDRIRRDLGLPEGARLRASLHNMLVYEPGQFFVSHQDSEKADDMIGTLVVILPSAFTGGAIVLEHHDERATFRGSGGKLTFIAFYADCRHQVRPVTKGFRVVLTFNLTVDGDTSTAALPVATRQVGVLARRIEEFFDTPRPPRWDRDTAREPPDRLVYLLDHQYTQKGLAWSRLKNADAARAAALREVARRLDCEIFLALADVHESWLCEDEEFGYGAFRRRRGWPRGYDEASEDEADGSETPALVELYDTEIQLRHWIATDGRLEAMTAGVDSDEVCDTKASVELQPYRSEHEGYMGNEGNTVDRWYHRAAVVLWPRARNFVIRAKVSPRWAIDELGKVLAARDVEQARGMARQLVPFWARVVPGEAGAGFLGRTIALVNRLDSPDLAASLLQPFTLERLTPAAARPLVALGDRYGMDWCRAILGSWASEDRRGEGERQKAWLTSLPGLCQRLCDAGSHGLEIARWLVTAKWARVVEQCRRLREVDHPKRALDVVVGMSKPTLGLLESSLIARSPDLHGEMVRFLVSEEADYPIHGLIHLLRTAHGTRTRAALRDLRLAELHAHCEQVLTTWLQAPVREKNDWSIAAPRRCACRLCAMLARFLSAPDQVRFEWPLAKDGRAHIHRLADAHDLPVTHVTRRAGRPYALVLTKTDALFEREASERAVSTRERLWLRRTARAF